MTNPIFSLEEFAAKARETVAEGCVLLRNEKEALPIEKGSKIAVFGRTQMNYYKSGLGSGGLVNTRYVTGIYEALQKEKLYVLDEQVRSVYESWTEENPFDSGDGWSNHPWFQQEMPLSESLVKEASERNDAAIIIIGRTAGEDNDNSPNEGSWLLTKEEEAMLEVVCRCFERTAVLLNVGNIIDMSWVGKYSPSAVMYVWQGGQEGGSGVADVLCGKVNPCGRLTDTIAESIDAYPANKNFGDSEKCIYAEDIFVGFRYFETFAKDKVLYPFGFGLSYTEFKHETVSFNWDGEKVTLRHKVTNIGKREGKEVVQVYASAPQGVMGKPSRVLCAFAKTPVLKPDESFETVIVIPRDRFVSYDDSGKTGHRSCYVFEKGEYRFFAGEGIRNENCSGGFTLPETVVAKQLEEVCAPTESFERMYSNGGKEAYETVPLRTVDQKKRRLERLPREIPQTEFNGFKLQDAAEGRCTMEEFIAQMTDDDLFCIVRGEGMSSVRVTPGTAGCIGGVADRLVETFGLPSVCCSDGPSGIRMDCGNTAFSMPNGTCQACTWNEELIEELYVFEGLEMRKYQVDNLLGPGMNIHRHPLCGRNFEYFSEDPLLTGRMAVSQLRGMEKSGVTATIKHYASNNQEYRRRWVNSIMSERALREIYLKGFEIAVKEGNARAVMTTYNPLNGCWTASEYDLVTTILRGEWGFDGIVMSDWWAMGSEEGKEPSTQNVASMVRAQNDLFMLANNPSENSGEDDSEESLKNGRITRAEYQRSALNICRFLTCTPAYRRSIGLVSEEDIKLQKLRDEEGDIILSVPEFTVGKEFVMDGSKITTEAGKSTLYQMKLEKRGVFEISVMCRAKASAPDTAQIPISVFSDSDLLGTKVLSGGEKEWQTLTFTTPEIERRLLFFLKFYFATGGMEIKEVNIKRIRTIEYGG